MVAFVASLALATHRKLHFVFDLPAEFIPVRVFVMFLLIFFPSFKAVATLSASMLAPRLSNLLPPHLRAMRTAKMFRQTNSARPASITKINLKHTAYQESRFDD